MTGESTANTRGGERLKKLREERVRCPLCGKNTLVVTDYLYEVPYVGKVILSVGRCSSCGYSFRDIRTYEAREPGKIVYRVESEDDVNTLLVKSASASVIIPELGLSMTPGPASEGFVTTIEGLLDRFLEALQLACKDESADKEKCREMEEKIKAAKAGRLRFTVVIVDPEGVSTIASPKAKRTSVTREELEELGYIVAQSGEA